VTITGTNFSAGATVRFDTTLASNVNVVNSTSITATTPSHAAGPVNVVVTNTNGQSATLANAGWLKPMGPLGYAYDSPGAGRQALYRCFINAPGWATHYVSNSPTCEGWIVEDLLGYVENW